MQNMASYVSGFRDFIDECKKIDEWREINGADWDNEIGALTEATAELVPVPPLLIFDQIKGYPRGYRVVSLAYASAKRVALALGLRVDGTKMDLARMASRKITEAPLLPPRLVSDGPVLENMMIGDKADMFSFPSPHFHPGDGGRYIGTGDVVICRDRQSGYVNMGTYRVQVHEKNLLGLWMSPGQQARQICQEYWNEGKACPVVIATGADPALFLSSGFKFPWGKSELDVAGGLRGRAIDVIPGKVTDLPIPAYAEIAIEGEVSPPSIDGREEGPFGEWPGYYAGGTLGTGLPQPVVRVKAIYHRDNPIIHDHTPMWPGAPTFGMSFQSGLLWQQLESSGIQGVTGVWLYNDYLIVVAINQKYAGHAKQVGHGVISCSSSARHGRYIVIVEEDIDPSNLSEVLWAMQTRVDPATDIEIIDGCWTSGIDPRVPPQKRKSGDFTNSRAIFYAVRPFTWRNEFPKSCRTPEELRRAVVEKYRNVIPFPPAGTPPIWKNGA